MSLVLFHALLFEHRHSYHTASRAEERIYAADKKTAGGLYESFHFFACLSPYFARGCSNNAALHSISFCEGVVKW